MTKFMEQSCPCFLFLLFFIFWKVSKVILYLHTLCLTQNCYNCLCFFVFFSSLSSLFLDRLVKFFDFWPQGLARSSNKPKTYLHYHNAHGDKTWQGWLVTYFEGLPPILIMWFCNILRQIKTNISALPQLWQQNVAVLWLT